MNRLSILITALWILISFPSQAQFRDAEPLAGTIATHNFITRELVYPEAELTAKQSGSVTVTFLLDENGNGSAYQIKDSFCESANNNAIDIVKKILWSPALLDSKPVATEMEYTIDYSPKAYRRYWKNRQHVDLPLPLEADTSYSVYTTRQLEETAKPYFADGSNMAQYIFSNMKYPEAAKAAEVQGTTRLEFIVEVNGSVSNIHVINSVGGGCDNEAIRLLEETHWIPAVKNGIYVRSKNQQDITFSIGNRNYMDGNAY